VKYNGVAVTTATFAGWSAIGAEAFGGGYQVVWQNGLQFSVWNVDSSGNFQSQVGLTGSQIQAYEPGFSQDFNGGGIAVRTVVESSGSTTLATIANYVVLSSSGSSLGQTLKVNGTMVQTTQFGSWTPLAAEMSGGQYYIAWKNGSADQYIGWTLDANGNWLSAGSVITGSSWHLQNFETTVGRDLNGDGTTGVVTTSIETGGNTTLTRVADSYFFNYGTTNVQLRYGGTYVAVGQFGSWAPLAVEKVGNQYYMAFKNGGADQYIAWITDANGNWQQAGSAVSGSTWYLQSFEPTVNYDLNSDGRIGPTVTTIETSGNSTLSRVADSFFLNYGSSNIQVQYGGAYVAAGQFGTYTPVAAEQTIGGNLVAWRDTSTGNYSVWSLGPGGNWLWGTGAIGSGTSMLAAIETVMQQDLNGGGIAGRSTVEGSGGTALYNVSGYLQMVRAPYTGPLLAYADNTYVTATQFGTAMGAEWIGNGYQVAWKTGSNSYNFWTTDVSGKYVSQTGNLAGSNAQMQSFESTFAQDLNGDGVIGINNTPFDIQIVFSGASQYQTYFEQAAQRWERIIRSDLTAVNSGTYGLIDDLRIDASVQFIDGTNGILAQAGWDLRRSSSDGGLPYHGIMRFDSSDINAMVNNGTFLSVVMHEMGHVLGLGTLWDTFGLRSGSSYIGTNANNAYRQLGGSGFVPLETTGGSGTAFAHWSEARFDRELMTGFSETGPPMPLSIVTIGGLQDLGYDVDYAQADPYSLGGLMAPDSYVDDRGMGGLDAIAGSSLLAPDAAGGGDTLAFNDAYDGPPLIDDRGQASTTGILTDFADADDGANADMSLLTAYMANSFVTAPGDGAGNVGTAQTTPDDILTRPNA
jgi:hypothetical protein